MSETNREGILRKVQALLAKAMSTPFEAEADSFRDKANELMDKYRLEQWELAQTQAGKKSSLKPVRQDIDVTWWYSEHGSFRSALWRMFVECAEHCAVIIANRKVNSHDKTIPAYGLESDLGFLQMLFTDLYLQMADKIKPKFDPDKSLGENVYRAKEAGMKYGQIARWAGHPEWIRVKGYSKKGYEQYEYDGIMIREMRKYAKANNLTVHKVINLGAYVEDFCDAYAWAVQAKLHEMRTGEVRGGDSMALAIRDITDLSREAMWEDFPDLRPHPEDCNCDRCHFYKCVDPNCTRSRCVEARKPVKKSYAKSRYREPVYAAQSRGAQAGQSARIMGRSEAVGKTKELK
jgi:hypothetical protein